LNKINNDNQNVDDNPNEDENESEKDFNTADNLNVNCDSPLGSPRGIQSRITKDIDKNDIPDNYGWQ